MLEMDGEMKRQTHVINRILVKDEEETTEEKSGAL